MDWLRWTENIGRMVVRAASGGRTWEHRQQAATEVLRMAQQALVECEMQAKGSCVCGHLDGAHWAVGGGCVVCGCKGFSEAFPVLSVGVEERQQMQALTDRQDAINMAMMGIKAGKVDLPGPVPADSLSVTVGGLYAEQACDRCGDWTEVLYVVSTRAQVVKQPNGWHRFCEPCKEIVMGVGYG
jgi:hypothetical protein